MQRKRLAAAALCGLYAALLTALFTLIETGSYVRLRVGESPLTLDPTLPFRSPHYRWTGLACMVAGFFFLKDVQYLFDPRQEWFGPSPARQPLQYAVMRLQRYAIIPFFFGYLLLMAALLPSDAGYSERVLLDPPAASRGFLIVFGVLFAIARRGHTTQGDLAVEFLRAIVAVMSAASRR